MALPPLQPMFGNFNGFDDVDNFMRATIGGQPPLGSPPGAAPAAAPGPTQAKFNPGPAETAAFQDLGYRPSSADAMKALGYGATADAAPAASGVADAAGTVGRFAAANAKAFPNFMRYAGYGARALRPVAGVLGPAIEGMGVIDSGLDPTQSKIQTTQRFAEGVSRLAGGTAGAAYGAALGAPAGGIGAVPGGIIGGALGYLAPELAFKVRDFMRGDDGQANAGKVATATTLAPNASGPATIDNKTQQIVSGSIPSAVPNQDDMVHNYGAPPAAVAAEYYRQLAAANAQGPVSSGEAIGPNAYGVPAGNVSGDTVNAVRAPDGSTVYTNFGAKPAARVATPALPINPATNLPYSSMMSAAGPASFSPVDVMNSLNTRYNLVRSLGAEKQLEKLDLGSKAVRVAQIKATADVNKIIAAANSKPTVLSGVGGSVVVRGNGDYTKYDTAGNVTVGKAGGMLPAYSQAGVKQLVATMKKNGETSAYNIRAKLKSYYPDQDIPSSWIQ